MIKFKNFGYKFLAPLFLSLLLIIAPVSYVSAAINSCQADVTPSAVQPNSQTLFNFIITNDGPSDVIWIQIQRPSTNFVINNAAWSGSSSTSDDQTTLYDGTAIEPSNSITVGVSSHAGESQTNGENWTVLASSDSDGSNAAVCTGNLDASVSGARIPDPDMTPPIIDQIKLSKLKSNSITISWVTDEPANSDITYGETSDYGQSSHDASFVTDHLLKLDNLASETSYHFMITSYDSSGNGVSSEDNTFLTPVTDPSLDNINGLSGALLKTVVPLKAIPTEKIPPTIKLSTDITKPQKSVPMISGNAEDNEALAGIYYSLDGGKNWLPVDSATGLGTKKASFSFTPQNLQDGDYQLVTRAIDTSSNQASTTVQILVIDRLPPTVGGNVVAVGSQILSPNRDNVISSLVGVDQKITLSAVGGPTSVTIVTTEIDKDKTLQSFSLTKSSDSGLWSGVLSYSKAGTYQLVANSVDGAGNKTSRPLNTVRVNQAGQIMDTKGAKVKAKVVVYTHDVETNSWVLWDGEAYDQPNPARVTPKGAYGLYLPEGNYYLKIEADGYRSVVTRSFVLDNAGTISADFKLNRKPGFDLGPIHLRLPWPVLNGSIINKSGADFIAPKLQIINSSLPQFSLPQTSGKNITTSELYGKPTILTFVSTWLNSAGGQLEILSDLNQPYLNVLAVSSGESVAKLSSYAKLAAYSKPIVADSDNQLFDKLGGSNIPVTYFIDRHGIVKKVMVGVLSKEELLKNVSL